MKSPLPFALALLVCALLASGCRKRSASLPPPPTPEAAPAPAPPAETPAPAPAPIASAPAPAQGGVPPTSQFNYVQGSSALDDLNKHLAWFLISKKRFPANVDELLAANRLPRPALPPGGQLVINQKTKSVDYVGPK